MTRGTSWEFNNWRSLQNRSKKAPKPLEIRNNNFASSNWWTSQWWPDHNVSKCDKGRAGTRGVDKEYDNNNIPSEKGYTWGNIFQIINCHFDFVLRKTTKAVFIMRSIMQRGKFYKCNMWILRWLLIKFKDKQLDGLYEYRGHWKDSSS